MGLTGEGTSADELWDLRSRDEIANHLRDMADAMLAAKVAEVGAEDWGTVERLVLIRTIDSLWVEHLTELDDMRRGIGLRGYAQQDPLNEFKREAFQLYDELRGLIRHGVASSIFRVTVTRQPADAGLGDPAVAAALARGAAALSGGNGSNRAGVPSGATAETGLPVPAGSAAAAGGAASASAAGSAILRGGPAAPPTTRPMRESLGDEPVSGGSTRSGGASASGPTPGHTPSGARIGRNDPCWCGSGAKYKKCHGR
jgi:preprotein translocase subunit SecA